MPPELYEPKNRVHTACIGIGWLALVAMCASAWAVKPEHDSPKPGSLDLSAQTRDLLRAEMREITAAVQALVPAIAGGRWDEVARTAEQIGASFVLEQQLTPMQREELERALPSGFIDRDRAFHTTAHRLAGAAKQRDEELVAFRFYQLVSACSGCHSQYARTVFPGYEMPPDTGRQHGAP